MRRLYYWDKQARKFVEGVPPPQGRIFGQAPYVIQDSITPYYHPAACQVIDSRKALRDVDKACGTITTDKRLPPDPSWAKEQARRRRADLTESLHRAVAAVDSGTAPLTEETRALCDRQNELVSSALNFDAFNVVGRKKNAKGKRFRRR